MRPRGTVVIEAEPFALWLNHRLEYWRKRRVDETGAVTELCAELGWYGETGLRRLYRMRNQIGETAAGRVIPTEGRGRVKGKRVLTHADFYTRRTVEEALHHAGVRLAEVYPYEALVDEFSMEYMVPRDLATRLADAWIETTWKTVWERVGLFVSEEDRPQCYCRGCKRTTRLFMGACDACGAEHSASLVAAVMASVLRHDPTPVTTEIVAQARWLRTQYQMPFQQIAVVMAVYHGVSKDESTWRKVLREESSQASEVAA